MYCEKGRPCIDPLFSMKLLIEKIREFNKETHLAFRDYVIAFDKVKIDKFFFKYYYAEIFPFYC